MEGPSSSVAYPRLRDAQLTRLRSYGTAHTVKAGEVLYGPGDATYDLTVGEGASAVRSVHTAIGVRA